MRNYTSENYTPSETTSTPLASPNPKASFRKTIPRLTLVGLTDNIASSPVSYITDPTSRTHGDEESTALLLESFPKWLPSSFLRYGPVNATLFATLLSCLVSALCWLFFPILLGRLLSWQFIVIILFTIVSVILCATSLIHLYYTQTTKLSTTAVVVVAVLLSVLSEIVLDGASSAQSYTLLLVILHTLLGKDSKLIMVVPCVVIIWEILVVVKLMIGLRFVPNDPAAHALCIVTRPLALLLGFLTIRIFTINLESQHTYLAKLMEDIHRQGLMVQAGQEMRQQLIHNIFPEDIAAQLVDAMQKYDKKASSALSATGRSSSNGTNPEGKGALFLPMPSNITRGFSASIGFADIVNFTALASSISPIELVETLNNIVQAIDRACARYPGVNKIKTIGDAYMAASHPPFNKSTQSFEKRESQIEVGKKQLSDNDCALNLMNLCDRMHYIVKQYSIAGNPLSIRVGVAYGPVVSGIIGLSKLCYDMWGDTVNTASRMESMGLPGATQVTPQLYELVKDQLHFVYRGVVEVKGKGPVGTWLHYPTEPQTNSGHHLNTIPPPHHEDTGTVHSWFSSFCVPFDSSSEGSSQVERRASVPSSSESGTSTPMLTIRSSAGGERVSAASPREVQQRTRFFSVESHVDEHVPMIIEEEEVHVVPPHPNHNENRFVSPRPASKAAKRVLTIREHDNNAVTPIISSSSSATSDTYTRSPSLLSVSSLPEVMNPIPQSSSSRPPSPPSVIVATEPLTSRSQSNLSVIALQSPRKMAYC